MKKWLIPLSLLSILAIAGFWYLKQKPVLQYSNQTHKETDIPLREPASTENAPKISAMPTTTTAKQKREWLGKMDRKVKFTNIASEDWILKLEKSLTRGLPSNTKVEINNERDLVIVNGPLATNAQQVVVIFNSHKKRSSYRAMVDAQSGKILRTWDHTIHETFRRPAHKGLTPYPIQQNADD